MSKTLTGVSLILLISIHPAWAETQRTTRPSGPPARVTKSHEADRAKLKGTAEEVAQAFLHGNFGRLADLTYPDLVTHLGGKARMVAQLEHDVQEMRAEGFEFLSDTIDEPTQVVRDDNGRLFAVLPTTLRIKVREGVLVGKGYLIGVSDDGSEWKFVDGSSVDKAKLRVLFGPSLADKLELPEVKPPVLERP